MPNFHITRWEWKSSLNVTQNESLKEYQKTSEKVYWGFDNMLVPNHVQSAFLNLGIVVMLRPLLCWSASLSSQRMSPWAGDNRASCSLIFFGGQSWYWTLDLYDNRYTQGNYWYANCQKKILWKIYICFMHLAL